MMIKYKSRKFFSKPCIMYMKYKAKLPFIYRIRGQPTALTKMWNREHSQN